MKDGMIILDDPKKKRNPFYQLPQGYVELPIRLCLPFYKSLRGEFIHRPRYGKTHIRHGVTSHGSLEMWCGTHGFVHPDNKKQTSEMFTELPEKAVLCVVCEEKAIAAGLPASKSAFDIQFSPERKS